MAIDWTKPIQRTDGMKARLLGMVSKKNFPAVAAMGDPERGEFIGYFSEDGKSSKAGEPDLENVPSKIRIHVYKDTLGSQKFLAHEIEEFTSCDAMVKEGNGVIVELEI